MKERQDVLMHVYHTIAVHFAALHDTPERMLERDCITEIVPWRESRNFFYYRFKRLILEESFIREIIKAKNSYTFVDGKSMLRHWFTVDVGPADGYLWDQNDVAVDWLEKQKTPESIVNKHIYAIKKEEILSKIKITIDVGFTVIIFCFKIYKLFCLYLLEMS